MVERQLARRGITDRRVLAAMGEIPREAFVEPEQARRAYADSALAIGERQTISQPWVVAAICQALALDGSERVLEIGTGSGYSTAVLAHLAREVVSVERIDSLAARARGRLADLGFRNVTVRTADGSLGAPDAAPFPAIAVHASAPAPPPSLLEQLESGGRLVVPVAEHGSDTLTLLVRGPGELDPRTGAGVERHVIAPCRFVPLLGEQGFGEG